MPYPDGIDFSIKLINVPPSGGEPHFTVLSRSREPARATPTGVNGAEATRNESSGCTYGTRQSRYPRAELEKDIGAGRALSVRLFPADEDREPGRSVSHEFPGKRFDENRQASSNAYLPLYIFMIL